MMKKQLAYDDDELVELIAEGQLTYRAIGQRVGISEGLVKKIAQGRRRKDLARRLWDTEEGLLTEARRIGSRYARSLIMEQVRLGLTGEGEPARRAREFVLKFTMAARPRKGDLPQERQRRSEQELQDCRDMGIVPWEDELDAEMARDAAAEEKATGNGQSCFAKATQDTPGVATGEAGPARGAGNGGREMEAAPAVASMAAVAVMPPGPGNPARASAR
ncbi:MAG: hypothetical protein NTV86_22790 [Planctomycetota bacterium]|nr:hypothetical protein [Planctomycetota bacterium]